MAGVNETLVREYFESLGFFVLQPLKYQVAARSKRPDEEVDLIVCNPAAEDEPPPEPGIWTAADLRTVRRAAVSVRGWHTDRFSPSLLDKAPELFRFAESEAAGRAARLAGSEEPITHILVISRLPNSDRMKSQALKRIRQAGVDGILLFPILLLELSARLDPNSNYEKSDLLQLLRILKNYDLLRDAQMEFMLKHRRAPGHVSGGNG
jgi:hypothetical protein